MKRPSPHRLLPHRAAMAFGALALLCLGLSGRALAQTYSEFDPVRSAASTRPGVANPDYITPQQFTEFVDEFTPNRYVRKFRDRRAQLEESPRVVANDRALQMELAVALLWTGGVDIGTQMLFDLVQQEPDNVALRRNLATGYERHRLYSKAWDEAKEAQRLDLRPLDHLETLRLLRLEYLVHCEADPEWAKKNHFLHEFTGAFNNRKLPPNSFPDFKPTVPPDTYLKQLIDMLHHEANFADAYLCLGMISEVKGDAINAWKLYHKAVDHGHPRTGEIKIHINSMGKILPRGFTIVGSVGVFFRNLLIGLACAGVLVATVALARRWRRKRAARLAAAPPDPAKRKGKWKPEEWRAQQEAKLYESLEKKLGRRDQRIHDKMGAVGEIGLSGPNTPKPTAKAPAPGPASSSRGDGQKTGWKSPKEQKRRP